MLDFTLSPEQQQLQLGARAFAKQFLAGASTIYGQHDDQASRFRAARPIYQAAFASGLIKGQIPTQLGGAAGKLVDSALVVEELYAVDPTAALTILGTGLGLTPLILAGSPEHHERLLKPFLAAEGDTLASFVHSEPTGTANWLEKGGRGLQTTARRDGDDWIINGEKLWATNSGGWEGEGAGLQCVVCRLSDDPGSPQDPSVDPASLILILVVTSEVLANNEPGAFHYLGEQELAGHTAASGPHIRFTNLRVPGINLLAPPGKGAEIVEATFGASAAIVGAMSVGIMRAVFETALGFARSDSRGGSVSVVERQSVADLLINIKMRTETSRLLTWKALHCLEEGPGDFKARLELTLEAKIFSSDNAVQCAIDAMKLVGVKSYSKDMPLSRILNDAICLPLFDGGNVGVRRRQIQNIFASEDYSPWSASFE